MVKGSSSLCSVLVLLAITFAGACDTNISYQIGEFNNKLTYLQGRLDLFDYITEGNVSVLQHRVEIDENMTKQVNETILKVNNLVDRIDTLATHLCKLNTLESKINALETTVSINVSTVLHRVEAKDLKYTENIAPQLNETNVKLNDLESKLNELATTVSSNVSTQLQRVEEKDLKYAENIALLINETNEKVNALESKFNELASTVSSNVSTLLHRVEAKDLKFAENIVLQMNETNVKVNNLVDRMELLASDVNKLNRLESKFDTLTTTVSRNVSMLMQRVEAKDLKFTENIALLINESNVKLNSLESKFNELASTVSSNVSKYAQNLNVQMNETNVKVNHLVDRMESLATDVSKLNTLEGKLNALTTTLTNFVGEMKETLLKPSSCVDALVRRSSGVYNIQLNGNSSPFNVYCMADPKGGLPWTVVQRRVDGSVDFYRNWTEYQRGFGDLEGNFFIGLDKLHTLTTKGEPQELWVMLTDQDGISAHAYYDAFAIGNEAEEYPLNVLGEYSGDAGDSLSYHKSMKFTTHDNDNDFYYGNCAEYLKSAWWFHNCHNSHLNGVYGSTQEWGGLNWYRFRDDYVSKKYAHMAIRPARK